MYHSVGAPLDESPDRAADSLGDLLVEVNVGEHAVVVVAVDLLNVAVRTLKTTSVH